MDEHQIVIFDGLCNFCNGAVNFIIRRDRRGVFSFVPMQSETAQQLLARHDINGADQDTIVLIANEYVFVKSEAALEICKHLSGGWKYLRIFRILPRRWRDWLYTRFAKNRYRLFGKRETCMVPTPELKERFLN